MNEELKPCPFCGSDEIRVNKGFIRLNHDIDGYQVECYNCHSVGWHESEERAIKSWNRRVRDR